MSNHLPVILIKAKEGIQKVIRPLPLKSLQADCIFTESAREAENLFKSSIIDLIIYQIEDTGKKMLNINFLHTKLTKKTPVPVIYLVKNGRQKIPGLDKIEPGSFDLITEPIEKHLLINKITNFLKIIELKKELAGISSNLPVPSKLKNNKPALSKKLSEKTKQLSREIKDHIKTKPERYHKNKSLNEKLQVFSALLGTIPNPMVIKNHKGEYLQCNRAFEQFFGIKSSELSGKTAFDFFDRSFADKMKQFDNDQVKRKKARGQEHAHIKPDGTVVHVMIYKNVFSFGSNAEPGTITTIVDVTHLKRAEDLLNVQYTIDYIASLEKGIQSALNLILDHIFKLYWVDGGGIYLYDKNHNRLTLVCHKGLSAKYARKVKTYTKNSTQVQLLLKGSNLYVKSNKLSPEIRMLLSEQGILSVAILPLINSKNNEIIGSLNLASKNFEQITEQDKKGIESISTRIINLILYAQSQEKVKESQLLLEQKVAEKTRALNKKINELITKQKEIRLSEKKYRKLQDNLPLGIFSSTPQGKIIYGNQSAIKMFGYDSWDDINTIPVTDMYYSKEQRTEIIQTLITKGKLPETEVQLVRKDKSTFWGLVRSNAVYNNKGIPIQFDGIIENISDIKNAKLKLEEANKKITSINKNLEKKIQEALSKHETQNALLIQKSKLESLGELSAGIAHEINQPLGVMALTFENLKLKINAEKLTPEYLDTKFQSIEDNMRRIREIIDHIRTFSRDQESFVLNKVNVNKVVRKALSMIGAQYSNHNITIRLDLKEDIGFTVGSNLKLEQVILNLLANSKYALEEKGTFEGETDFSKEILIKTDTTPDKIILLIEDNGAGIKAKHLTRIFDPFFTTKPEGFGTGLGLSIVYGLVKDMRGEIVVDSKERKYTKFRITFPRFPEKD